MEFVQARVVGPRTDIQKRHRFRPAPPFRLARGSPLAPLTCSSRHVRGAAGARSGGPKSGGEQEQSSQVRQRPTAQIWAIRVATPRRVARRLAEAKVVQRHTTTRRAPAHKPVDLLKQLSDDLEVFRVKSQLFALLRGVLSLRFTPRVCCRLHLRGRVLLDPADFLGLDPLDVGRKASFILSTNSSIFCGPMTPDTPRVLSIRTCVLRS